MNQKNLLILFALFFLSLNVNALISNPNFESVNSNVFPDSNANNWTILVPSDEYSYIYDENGQCYTNVITETKALPSNAGAWIFSPASGLYDFMVWNLGVNKYFVLKNDYYIGTLTNDLNFCFSFKQNTIGKYNWGYGITKTDDTFCGITLSVGSPVTTWINTCRTIPAGVYNGYFSLFISRPSVGGSGTYFLYIDNGFSGTNLTVDILNYSPATAYADSTVTFKTKLMRTDLNQFISDANMQFYSKDFNGTMAYNSSTNYYELSHVFLSSQPIGTYDFNVRAISTGDANYLKAFESFSISFIKSSNLIIPVSNTVKLTEYQFGTNDFIAELIPSTESNDMIFYFNGNDSNIYGSLVDLNFLIYNSDLSGKRYSIYTATEQEYLNGAWSFDSTLTFGSTYYNGLQKIWLDANNFFKYSFFDGTNFGNEIKYFKLKYDAPFKTWNSLHTDFQNEWDLQFLPSFVEANGHYRDYFPISTYNGVRNQYKTLLPDINKTGDYNEFLLAFNGQIPSGTFTELIGSHRETGQTDVVSSVTVSSNEKTFYVPVGYDYPLMKGDSATYVQLMNSDYALFERGYFIEAIELLNSDYSAIEKVLIEDSNGFVIGEGVPFRIKSKLVNKNRELSFLEAKVYFYGVNDNNQVAYFRQDLNSLAADGIYSLNWLVDGIIDLNGTAARDFVVVLKATNKTGTWAEIQTTTFKLRQYPYSTADLSLNAFLSNKIVGEHLSGNINLKISSPNTLRGLKFYVYRYEDGINGGYTKTFWKNQDFSCSGFTCSFNFELKDQVFDGAGVWFFAVSALLTTQNEDVNNILTTKYYSFYVNFLEFETARIFQTIERNPDFNYTNTEPIPLVLQLRDADKANLKNKLNVKLFLTNCDQNNLASTKCISLVQDINYAPDSFLFDISTGYNYFFWRKVFIDQDGTLLDNLDFYSFTAVITDISGSRNGEQRAVLTRRCANDTYTADFVGNSLAFLNDALNLGWNFAPDQCTLPPEKIVVVGDANELRLNIDNSITLNPPNLECVFVANADNNANYVNNLEQDLIMGGWYNFNDQAIDKFDFYLLNDYSDSSKEGSNKQFIKVSVPYELVAFNDLALLRQSMAQNYGTTANTTGELLQQGLNYLFSGIAQTSFDVINDSVMQGVTNLGVDCNFNRPIDPTYIQGLIFFKLKGIKTINKQDMVILHKDLNVVPAQDLIEFMNYQNYSVPRKNTTYEVYVSDMVKVMNGEVNDPLVIDVPIGETKYSNQGIDQNTGFASLPSKLKFYFLMKQYYNSELNANSFIVPITITAIITGTWIDFFGGIQELIDNPAKVLIENWFWIFLALMLLLVVSIIRMNWNKGTKGI